LRGGGLLLGHKDCVVSVWMGWGGGQIYFRESSVSPSYGQDDNIQIFTAVGVFVVVYYKGKKNFKFNSERGLIVV
jgi:hypothetical protein